MTPPQPLDLHVLQHHPYIGACYCKALLKEKVTTWSFTDSYSCPGTIVSQNAPQRLTLCSKPLSSAGRPFRIFTATHYPMSRPLESSKLLNFSAGNTTVGAIWSGVLGGGGGAVVKDFGRNCCWIKTKRSRRLHFFVIAGCRHRGCYSVLFLLLA